MDFQAVPPPTQSYGAPNVFQQQQQQPAQGGQPAQGQQGQGSQIAAALAKAKQLLSSGQISSDQYSQLAGQLSTMGGNMGSTMPGSPGAAPPGAPLNIMPGAGG